MGLDFSKWYVLSDQVHNLLLALASITATLGFGAGTPVGTAIGAAATLTGLAASALSGFNVNRAANAVPPNSVSTQTTTTADTSSNASKPASAQITGGTLPARS